MSAAWLAAPAFLAISFVFSMLGMGGSQLYIPVLYWLGMDFKAEAVPLGMLLNVASSGSAALTYGRAGLVEWRVALPFGASMVALAPVGARVNMAVPAGPLVLVFAAFTAAAAVLMLAGWRPRRPWGGGGRRLALGVAAGAVLGFFAGLIGRGGGSFAVPLLYLAGLEPKAAAATSAVVVSCSGTASFLSHLLGAARPRWGLWLACLAAVVAGSQAGSRFMARRLRPRSVKVVFGAVLLLVALLLAVGELAR